MANLNDVKMVIASCRAQRATGRKGNAIARPREDLIIDKKSNWGAV